LIVQINNTICHIYPIFTFFDFILFLFSFFFFFGNLSLINNHINNICDLRSPSHNKLVHGDKNDNIILNLTRILGKFNTEKKNVKISFPLRLKKKKKMFT
jgi:hypothetical protein